jgi:hypothetical protein
MFVIHSRWPRSTRPFKYSRADEKLQTLDPGNVTQVLSGVLVGLLESTSVDILVLCVNSV